MYDTLGTRASHPNTCIFRQMQSSPLLSNRRCDPEGFYKINPAVIDIDHLVSIPCMGVEPLRCIAFLSYVFT